MNERSWVLIGMMGSGKSSVGRMIARESGRAFQDTDAMIEQRLGRSIASFFQLYGEPAFRDHESSVLRSLEPGLNVVATGGGIVLRPQNWTDLRRLGKIVYLQASAEELVRRLAISRRKRPLLAEDGWKERIGELLTERETLYRQADTFIDIDGVDLPTVAARVQAALEGVV